MEIMLKIWDYWFFICSGIALFILYVEITTKVNGANGLIWLVITSLLACATLVLWFISIIFFHSSSFPEFSSTKTYELYW